MVVRHQTINFSPHKQSTLCHRRGDHWSSVAPSCHSERRAKPVVEPVGRCEASESTRASYRYSPEIPPRIRSVLLRSSTTLRMTRASGRVAEKQWRNDHRSSVTKQQISTAQTINPYHGRGDLWSSVAKQRKFHRTNNQPLSP